MLATASAQVCVPLGHSSLYYTNASRGLSATAQFVLFTQLQIIRTLQYTTEVTHLVIQWHDINIIHQLIDFMSSLDDGTP